MRKKSEDILRLLLKGQSKSAILGLQADLRKLTQVELAGLLDSLNVSASDRADQGVRSQTRQSGDGGPVSRVLHLLLLEAKLTDEQAILELKRELGDSAASSGTTEEKSLERWARRASEIIPAGEIVGAALTVAERMKAARKSKSGSSVRARKGA